MNREPANHIILAEKILDRTREVRNDSSLYAILETLRIDDLPINILLAMGLFQPSITCQIHQLERRTGLSYLHYTYYGVSIRRTDIDLRFVLYRYIESG